MAGLHGSLEKVLQANPGKDYCASCLADAVGLRSPEDRIPVARLMRRSPTERSRRAPAHGEDGPDCQVFGVRLHQPPAHRFGSRAVNGRRQEEGNGDNERLP